MTRMGQNPAKFINSVAKPEKITVAILNHIPFEGGFYAEMRDVLDACLGHIHRTADLPFDLMVFDNGSSKEIQQYLLDLHYRKIIQYLLLSDKNLGKGGAWNFIFNAAPGEIIAYADNDVLFYPKWLSRSVELLETYPNVGMVTARPFRTREEYYSSTIAWAMKNKSVRIEEGNIIPWESFLEFNLSIATPEEEIKKVYDNSRDFRLTFKGIKAHAGASHWQFTAYKRVLQEFLPFQMDKPMGQVKQLDERMNKAGYLRLMVSDPLAMNMSNSLPATLRSEKGKTYSISKERSSNKILEFKPIKSFLLGVHNQIFKWYYGKSR